MNIIREAFSSKSVACILLIVSFVQIGGVTSQRAVNWFYQTEYNVALPIWIACYVLAFLYLVFKFGHLLIGWFLLKNRLLSTLIVIACLSTMWSVDYIATFNRAVHLVGICFVAIQIGSNLSFQQITKISIRTLLVIQSMSLAVSIIIPEFGITNSSFEDEFSDEIVWRGFSTDKNALGILSVLGIYFGTLHLLLYRKSAGSISAILTLFFGVVLLLNSNSATSISALSIGILIAFLLLIVSTINISSGVVLAFSTLLLSGLFIIAGLFEYDVSHLTANIGHLNDRSSDLTGRLPLWERAWEITLEHPFIGHGYGTLWGPNGEHSESIYQDIVSLNWQGDLHFISHAHNGFLNISTQLGVPFAIIALVPVLGFTWFSFKNYLLRKRTEALFVVSFMAIFIAYNITEVSLFYSRNLLWFLFLVFLVNTKIPKNLTSSNRSKKPRRRVIRPVGSNTGLNKRRVYPTTDLLQRE